jgi:hypothetical protein
MQSLQLIMAAESSSGVGSALASGLIGATLGAIATTLVVVFTPWAQRCDRYDAALLTRRMTACEALDVVLEPTSRYAEALGRDLEASREPAPLRVPWYAGTTAVGLWQGGRAVLAQDCHRDNSRGVASAGWLGVCSTGRKIQVARAATITATTPNMTA